MKGKTFTLADDSADARDHDMRGALAAASDRFALPFVLPDASRSCGGRAG